VIRIGVPVSATSSRVAPSCLRRVRAVSVFM
jgi:hypothetical protein